MLVLDFDGVIADGSVECALVTWNAHFRRPVHDFSPDGLARVPDAFLDRFRHSRGHARHLGHFLVPLLAGSDQLTTQAEFDDCFAAIPGGIVDRFVEEATRYRAAVRRRHPRRWLGYHAVYDGVVDVLSALTTPWYVVTAKDATSVLDILAAHGVELEPDRVHGDQSDKTAALADIASREGVPPQRVHFFDDSLANVVAARGSGHDARWARWGFHTPEHSADALRLGVPVVDLDDLGPLTRALLAGETRRAG